MKLSDIADLIESGNIKKVVVMAGAGISTAAGIPDFRSPETGLYANLEKFALPYPEAIFDIDYFVERPEAFYALARELCPGKYKPTITHQFIRLLEIKGILKRCFTQNVDTLERLAEVSQDLIVEAHGSFAKARCLGCRQEMMLDELKPLLLAGKPVRCQAKSCRGNPRALIKPDIVFFGEGLPQRFFAHLSDLPKADLLIVLGTSLQVQPFASLVTAVSATCVRLLINLERVGEEMFKFDEPGGRDVLFLGQSDDGVKALCKRLGWMDELHKLCKSSKEDAEGKTLNVLTEHLVNGTPTVVAPVRSSVLNALNEPTDTERLEMFRLDKESVDQVNTGLKPSFLDEAVVESDSEVQSLGKGLEELLIDENKDNVAEKQRISVEG